MNTFTKAARSLAIAVALVAGSLTAAHATTYTLEDDNASATYDAIGSGMNNWTVDGVNQLYDQTFFVRVGSQGGEHLLQSLTLDLAGVTDTDFNGKSDTLYTRYHLGDLKIEVRYTLDGGTIGSHSADIGEQITLTNLGRSSLDVHFFQYSDFDLGGTPGNDTAHLSNANTVDQVDPTSAVSETVVTPHADHWQIATYAALWNALIDGNPTTLSDSGGGTGDMTWAFEWDRTLSAGGSFQISKDKRIAPVPEPGTVLLMGSGLLGLALWGRRRMGQEA